MYEDRLDELEEIFDGLKESDPTAAANLGAIIDRIEDGLTLGTGHIVTLEKYLD